MRTVIKNINASHPLKNITRRDKSFHGWEFQKNVNNRKTSVLFKDSEYGDNPALSLAAAVIFRDGFNNKPSKKVYNHMGVLTSREFQRMFA